jgi:hypothetical protein
MVKSTEDDILNRKQEVSLGLRTTSRGIDSTLPKLFYRTCVSQMQN